MAKIKLDFLSKSIEKKLKMLQAKAIMQAASDLEREIKDNISKGISPVEGAGRFVGYSDSYLEQIKNKTGSLKGSGKLKRPVNLKVTGKMMNSIKKRLTMRGFVLWFASPIAKYHNEEGAGKSKVIRKMLPDENQSLSRSITRRIAINIRKMASMIFKGII